MGRTKYAPKANTGFRRREGLSEEEVSQLEELCSLGLAKKTWANYRTAERLLAMCCREKNIKLELPVSENTVISFVLWLAFKRNVCAATINNYLAGIRQLHLSKGAKLPIIRSDLVKLILKGKLNKDTAMKRSSSGRERKPVTPDVLRILKNRIADSNLGGSDQRLVWAVSTAIFFGAFRGSELLCREQGHFDPAFTLCSEDMKVTVDNENRKSLQFKIKAPKEDKVGKSIIVDVFEGPEDICAVRAMCKWLGKNPPREIGQPLFRWKNGLPLTSSQMNNLLRDRLSGFIEGGDKFFTTHSFRTGAASMMGTLGFDDGAIKALGRWSSRAYETYLRLPRTKRIKIIREWNKEMGKITV